MRRMRAIVKVLSRVMSDFDYDATVDAIAEAALALVSGERDRGASALRELCHADVAREFFRAERSVQGAARVQRTRDLASLPAAARVPGLALNRRLTIWRRDSFTCQYCGSRTIIEPMIEWVSLCYPDSYEYDSYWPEVGCHWLVKIVGGTVDHVKPRARGGTNDAENLVTACNRCNYVKEDFLIEELGWADPRAVTKAVACWQGLSDVYARLRAADTERVTQAGREWPQLLNPTASGNSLGGGGA